jgi:hypothetical protein
METGNFTARTDQQQFVLTARRNGGRMLLKDGVVKKNKLINLFSLQPKVRKHVLPSSVEWYLVDNLHRTNGPAVKWHNDLEEWWVNGERHRLDGPAIIYRDCQLKRWDDSLYYRTGNKKKVRLFTGVKNGIEKGSFTVMMVQR